MKAFECQRCGNVVHFDSITCVNCGSRLGYLPDRFEMTAVEPSGERWRPWSATESPTYVFCDNARFEACNWLLADDDETVYCQACRHNRTVPDLSRPGTLENWQKLELAKRRLFYSLLRWRLPVPTRSDDPNEGLVFDFLEDVEQTDGTVAPVMTGHQAGLITINIAEADDAERERRRTAMGEPYRTLIGHFRHEVGHFFWDRLVRDRHELDAFRSRFGDEREDYGDALARYHADGPRPDWRDAFISAYATAHPWEDFAETWAHYVHMVDALETAWAFGMYVRLPDRNGSRNPPVSKFDPYAVSGAAELVAAWVPMTIAVNSVNRSMGQPDLYPFVLSKPVIEKLQFVHEMIHRP